MPCWQVREVEVDVSNTSKDVLIEALKHLGFTVNEQGGTHVLYRNGTRYGTLSLDGKKITTYGSVINEEELKLAIQRKTVEKNAKRLGWQVVVDKKDKNKVTLRRSY